MYAYTAPKRRQTAITKISTLITISPGVNSIVDEAVEVAWVVEQFEIEKANGSPEDGAAPAKFCGAVYWQVMFSIGSRAGYASREA
jgi:hypothetical protein